MVRTHNRYDFNAFTFFDICLMAQNTVGLGECLMSTGGDGGGGTVHSAVVGWRVHSVSTTLCWLTALFKSLFLPSPPLEILSVAEKRVFKSPTITMDLSSFSFNYISFASWIFRLCYWVYTYLGSLFFPGRLILLRPCNVSLRPW